MVGVRAIRESGRTGVIFSPNIAIRGQWQAAAPEVRCLTYQALANFGDDPGGSTQLARLHPNGRALVAELAATENLMIGLRAEARQNALGQEAAPVGARLLGVDDDRGGPRPLVEVETAPGGPVA